MKNPGFNFENTYTNLPKYFFSELKPDIVTNPSLVILNKDLCEEIDLDFQSLVI